MKFIHTADIHIGHPFTGLNNLPSNLMQRIENATFTSFKALIDFALEQQVDFILISGDLFDTQHQSVQVMDFLAQQFKRLVPADITVYLSFGNHDFNQTIAEFDFGKNVILFSGDVTTHQQVTRQGETVNIAGFSYREQHVVDKVIDQFPMRSASDYQIGMYHGSVDGQNGQYAPFTITDMRAKHYDYWALGHIHKRQVLSEQPFIAYPGNLQGQNIKEDGAKGFYFVTSNGQQLVPEFIDNAAVTWTTLPVDVPSVATQEDLLAQLMAALQSFTQEHANFQMMRLVLNCQYGLPQLLELRLLDGATLAQLNQALRVAGIDNLWINDVVINQKTTPASLPGIDAQAWEAAAAVVFEAKNIHLTGLKNVPEVFVTNYFDQPEVQAQLKHRAQLQLEVYMNEGFFDED